MHPRTSAYAGNIVCSLLATLILAATAWAQPGSLQSFKKINSQALANFGIVIDDSDEFGDATCGLPGLSGPGASVAAMAVGAVGDDDGGSHAGAVYVIFLNSAADITYVHKISETQGNLNVNLDNYDEFGGALAWLGDLDGPGPAVGAIAVGAVGDDDGGSEHGAVYILFVNQFGMVLSHKKISDTAGGFTAPLDDLDEFGGAVTWLGDLDGAGPSAGALAVGAIGDDDGGTNRGAVYILFLDHSANILSYQKISNTQGNFTATLSDNDGIGEDVAWLGDLDGAGPSVCALAASSIYDDDGGHDQGAVYVMFLAANGTVMSYQKISPLEGGFNGALSDGDNWGTGMATLGDLDGAGPSTVGLAVSASSDDGLGSNRGATYVLLLDATGNCISDQEISDTAGGFAGQLDNDDEFGGAVGSLGDLDGAGSSVEAMIVTASYDDDGGVNRGAVYVMFLEGGTVLAVDDAPTSTLMGLGQVWPNPFKSGTRVAYRVSEASQVRIDVWDVRGRLVRQLVQEQVAPGEHQTVWNGLDDSGRRLAPGTYFLRMSVNGRTLPTGGKAVLLR